MIYPIPETIPLLALIAGLLLGWSISRSSPHRKKTIEEPIQETDIYLESTEEPDEKFADCEWCGTPLDKRGKCPKCGPELRSKAPEIANRIGVNIEKAFEMAPSFRDRDDPDFLVVTILEAIEFIIGEEFPIEEALNPLITKEVKRWYEQAWCYCNPLPADD